MWLCAHEQSCANVYLVPGYMYTYMCDVLRCSHGFTYMHMNICVHVYISIHLCVPSCAGIQECLCGLTLVCAMIRDSACVLCCPRPTTTCVSMVWGWQGRGSVGGDGTSPYVSVLLYVLISGYTFSRYHLKLRHFSFWRRAIRSDTSPKSTPGFCKVGSQAGGHLRYQVPGPRSASGAGPPLGSEPIWG